MSQQRSSLRSKGFKPHIEHAWSWGSTLGRQAPIVSGIENQWALTPGKPRAIGTRSLNADTAHRQQFEKHLKYMWRRFANYKACVKRQGPIGTFPGNGSTGRCHFLAPLQPRWHDAGGYQFCHHLARTACLALVCFFKSTLPNLPSPASICPKWLPHCHTWWTASIRTDVPTKQLPPCHTWWAALAGTGTPPKWLLPLG